MTDPYAIPPPPPPPTFGAVVLDRLMGAGLVYALVAVGVVASLPLALMLGLWVRAFRWASGV